MTQDFISSTGVKIPKLIYGTAWKEDKTADLVGLALNLGFRGIDTACQPKHYKEPLVGQGIQQAYKNGLKREDLFIQTKFTSVDGQDPNEIPYDPTQSLPDQINESFEISKRNLKTDYIDSIVLHSPMPTYKETLLAWTTLEGLVKADGVKQIGISNCYDVGLLSKLYADAEIKPAVVQNRFYRETKYDHEIRNFCNKNHIFYQSFWTLKANLHIIESKLVTQIAKEKNKTTAQVFFRCLTQQKIYPLMGTTAENHMAEGLDIFSFSLSPEECKSIQKLGPYST